jgi:hypothetical protein
MYGGRGSGEQADMQHGSDESRIPWLLLDRIRNVFYAAN